MFSSNSCRKDFLNKLLRTTPSSRLQTFQESADGKLHFNPALIKHIERKHNEAFRKYLKTTEDPPNARDCTGATLLHIAATYGNEEIVKDLAESAFDVDLQDDLGQTPLMIALKNKYVFTAKVLLKLDCDVKIKDKVGACALQIAITMDPFKSSWLDYIPASPWTDMYWEIVGLMLDKLHSDSLFNSEKVAEQLLQNNCPLSHVVFMNDSEVMRIMIERGCPVNVQDHLIGETALHWAVKYCKLDKMKILLDHGADVDVLDNYEKTPLMYIYSRRNPRVVIYSRMNPPCEVERVKMLLERKASMLPVGSQVLLKEFDDIFRWGTKDAIRVALEKYDNLLLHRYYCTLLHVLAANSNPGVAEVIVGRNMDVDCRGINCNTALSHAIQFENDKLAAVLLEEGASLAIANNDRLTPMHLAFNIEGSFALEGRLKCLKLMLEHGGDPEIRFKDGKTILEVILSNQKLVPLAEPVLAQLAIKESLGASVSKIIRQQIRSHEQFNSYFDLCVNQLEEAKTIWLSRSVSLFEFLTSPNKLVSLSGRNRILVSKLSERIGQLTFDPYYMGILSKRFFKISQIAQSREKAVAILCENIGKHYGCNPIVTYTIVDFLSDEDVKYLASCSECNS